MMWIAFAVWLVLDAVFIWRTSRKSFGRGYALGHKHTRELYELEIRRLRTSAKATPDRLDALDTLETETDESFRMAGMAEEQP
jgi:hypothetical protein